MRVKGVNHLAIAAADAGQVRHLYQDLLGLDYTGSETVEQEGVSTHFFQAGATSLEILEPLSPDSPVGRFLEKRGPGIHHLALEVEGLDELVEKLKTAGIRLLSEVPTSGAHNMRIIFLHPASTGGVLIELCEPG